MYAEDLCILHCCGVVICVEAQRKRRTTGSPLVRSSTKMSRRVGARRAANETSMSNGNLDSAAEPIDVADSQ